MGAFHELTDMARDYGLGLKYFLLVGGALAVLMLALFLWGRVEETAVTPVIAVPVAVPDGTPASPSY
ncbi:MAG: hypothetical protein Q7R40_03190 [Phaeospirillum sp.]|nr:hypothetical protein [Phaeospirillum sp.]